MEHLHSRQKRALIIIMDTKALQQTGFKTRQSADGPDDVSVVLLVIIFSGIERSVIKGHGQRWGTSAKLFSWQLRRCEHGRMQTLRLLASEVGKAFQDSEDRFDDVFE